MIKMLKIMVDLKYLCVNNNIRSFVRSNEE